MINFYGKNAAFKAIQKYNNLPPHKKIQAPNSQPSLECLLKKANDKNAKPLAAPVELKPMPTAATSTRRNVCILATLGLAAFAALSINSNSY